VISAKAQKETLEFLSGGGEMGELTRSKDWGKTPLGSPENWPQSLRTLLCLLLNSKFPMFLWWGPEKICFYNDAYRPSLGENGKHPSILGMPGEKAWDEIWHMIGPLVEQVLATGEAVWFEDQLVPIYRNGHIEDVYWTFSYSPVTDDSGKRAGVFVTCTETTEKVRTFKSLEESNKRFINNIMQAPVAMCIFRGKDHVVEIANEGMLELWGKNAKEVMNKPIFVGLPEAKGQGLEALVDHVYSTGERFSASERPVGLPRNGKVEITYVNFTYEALKEADGSISGIVSTAVEVTQQVKARQKIEEAEEKTKLAISSAELGVYEIVYATNKLYPGGRFKEIWGLENVTDRTVYANRIHPDDLPVREKAHQESLKTGHLEYRCRIMWEDGSAHWVKITGKVIYDDNKTPVKLLGVIQDINSAVVAQQKLEESERNLRLMIHQAPVSIAIFRGADYVTEIANDRALELWGRKEEDVLGKPILDAMPELKSQGIKELLDNVYKTGVPFSTKELPVQLKRKEKLETVYVNFSYDPLYNTDGTINGIMTVGFDVSDQVIARQKISESEQNIRTMVLEAPIGICILDAATLVGEIVNESFLEVAGKPYEAIVGKFYWDAFAEARPYYEDALNKVVKEGKPFSVNEVELMLIRHGKEEMVFVTFVYAPLKDKDGKVRQVAIWVLENTVQVKARQKIAEAEERLRLATAAGGIATFDLDINTGNIFYSDSLAIIFGFDNNIVQSQMDLRDIIHPNDRTEIVEKAFDVALRTGHLHYEARVVKPGNVIGWVRTIGKVHYDKKGKPSKVMGTIRDITEEKNRQQELEESEKRLNIVIDASELGTWEMNLKTNEVIASDRYYEIFGYSRGSRVSYQKLLAQVHPEDIKIRSLALKKSFITGTIHNRHRIVRPDGATRWVETRGRAFFDDDNNPIKLVGTVRDISIEKQHEQELLDNEKKLDQLVKERTAQLERSNEDLQQFAHVASHDLKEPLRKIKIYANRLDEEYSAQMPEKAISFLSQIHSASSRMQMMIDGVLSFSSINSTKQLIEKVDLNNVVKQVQNDLEIIITQKMATIKCSELPTIEGAEILIYQLFYNLVNNALKFSKPDTPPLIEINATKVKIDKTEYAKIIMQDNGIGFDQEYAEHIFNTFTRLNAKDEFEGTGLGLTLCKNIVERHNGNITALGVDNKGAQFTIILPMVQFKNSI